MLNKILLWILSERVSWGEAITKPFDLWLYKKIK